MLDGYDAGRNILQSQARLGWVGPQSFGCGKLQWFFISVKNFASII